MSGKPKKLKKLTDADYWKIIQRFYNAQHKSGTKKSLDYADEKYSTKSGDPRKETIMEDLSDTQKQFIARAYKATQQDGKSTNKTNLIENTARSLRINSRFLQSMSNIFSDSFLEPVQPEQIAEALPEVKVREVKETVMIPIDINSNISVLKQWLRQNKKFKNTQKYKEVQERVYNLQAYARKAPIQKSLDKNKSLYESQLEEEEKEQDTDTESESEEIDTSTVQQAGETQTAYVERLKKLEAIELLKEAVGETISQDRLSYIRDRIQELRTPRNTNLLKGESYEGLIKRFKKLIAETSEDIKAERLDDLVGGRLIGQYAQRIQRAQTQIKTRDEATEQLSDILGKQEERAVSREEKATEQRKEISTAVRSIRDVIRGDTKLEGRLVNIETVLKQSLDNQFDVKRDVTYKMKKPTKKSKLSKDNIDKLVKEIPEQYRSTLAPTVRSLFSGSDLDANTIASGIIGTGLALSTGSPIASRLGVTAFNFLRESLGYDFNNIFQPPLPSPLPPLQPPPIEQLPPSILPRPTVVSEKLKPPQVETKHTQQIGLDLADVDEIGARNVDFAHIPVSDDKEMPDFDIDESDSKNVYGDIVSMLTNFFSRTYDVAVSQALLRRTINYLARLPTTVIPLLYRITKGRSPRDIDFALMTAGVALSADMERQRDFEDIQLDMPEAEQKASPSVIGKRGVEVPRLVRPTLQDVNQGVTAGTLGAI
jgi:hypothetical protein